MALFGGKKKGDDRGAPTKSAAPMSSSAGGENRANPSPRSPLQETLELDQSETASLRRRKSGDSRATGKSGPGAEETSSSRTRRNSTKAINKGEAVAIIGKSIIFKGELSGDEDLEIDGDVEGDIKLPNHELTIGAHGKVKASVTAKSVQVIGRVSGNVSATERVEIQATGIVDGDITAPRLLVQEGAVVNGSIHMTKDASSAAAFGKSSATTGAETEAPRKVG